MSTTEKRNVAMRNLVTNAIVVLVAVFFSSAGLAQSTQHDPHDLSGVWSKTWRTLALGEQAPAFTAWGKERFDANKPGYGPRAVPPGLGNDPTGKCDPLGLIRNLLLEVSNYQLELLQ